MLARRASCGPNPNPNPNPNPDVVVSAIYTADLFTGRRRETREVKVGDVGIGGRNPVRVQSMTNTDTRDVRSTVDQIEALAAVDCEIVRLTVPSIRDAEILPEIRAELAKRNVGVPLVADIHFTPNAAMLSVDHVEKIRINPGNYVDKKKFEVREFSDADYEREVEKVADRFRPLVKRCKQSGTAMRIGTNHGSLSDRIMNRFGDTPLGMVESALEFLDVCEAENFHDIVFSMKASNTQVAIQAYRMLAQRLDARPEVPGGTYPFHIGVTEAGDGEDGRIKSGIGIGALLEDGLGDTVRVSLTEHPVREVPVAEALAKRAIERWREDELRETICVARETARRSEGSFSPDPFGYTRRPTRLLDLQGLTLGGGEAVRVEVDLGSVPSAEFESWAEERAKSLSRLSDVECESLQLSLGKEAELSNLEPVHRALAKAGLRQPLAIRVPAFKTQPGSDVLASSASRVARWVVRIDGNTPSTHLSAMTQFASGVGAALEWRLECELPEIAGLVGLALEASRAVDHSRVLFSTDTARATHATRLLAVALHEGGAGDAPIVLHHRVKGEGHLEGELVDMAIDLGAPLCDGIGDFVTVSGNIEPERAVDQAYRVLQGARLRATRTEFISCPSCGRTLFDLEEVTARIKSDTDHLKGVKIAIMGCIVNGPGEMADADFGYVGSGVGKVTLYVGKEVVVRSIREDDAPGRLIELIKDAGRWVDRA